MRPRMPPPISPCTKTCTAAKVIRVLFMVFGGTSTVLLVVLIACLVMGKDLSVGQQLGAASWFGVSCILWCLQLPCMKEK